MALTKTIVRVGVISALAAVAGLAIVGPVRARLLVDKVGNNINSAVDSCIDDPAALKEPAWHVLQVVAPAAAKVPAAQVEQLAEPLADANVPG